MIKKRIYRESRQISEMDWNNIQQKLANDKRPYARKLSKKVGAYIDSVDYQNIYGDKLKPRNRKELVAITKEIMEQQGGVNVDLSMIDTSLITDMNRVFTSCKNLKSLDLSGWRTSKVKDMSFMFQYCENLESLNLSYWNTSNVEDMAGMFLDCSTLTSLDLSYFDTSKVKKTYCMFEGCKNLESLDLSGFDTSNVEDMGSMFEGCKMLRTSISHFNLDSCKYMDNMLKDTRNIECDWDNAEELMESGKRFSSKCKINESVNAETLQYLDDIVVMCAMLVKGNVKKTPFNIDIKGLQKDLEDAMGINSAVASKVLNTELDYSAYYENGSIILEIDYDNVTYIFILDGRFAILDKIIK